MPNKCIKSLTSADVRSADVRIVRCEDVRSEVVRYESVRNPDIRCEDVRCEDVRFADVGCEGMGYDYVKFPLLFEALCGIRKHSGTTTIESIFGHAQEKLLCRREKRIIEFN